MATRYVGQYTLLYSLTCEVGDTKCRFVKFICVFFGREMIVSYGGEEKVLTIHVLSLRRVAKYTEQHSLLDTCDMRNGFEEFGGTI